MRGADSRGVGGGLGVALGGGGGIEARRGVGIVLEDQFVGFAVAVDPQEGAGVVDPEVGLAAAALLVPGGGGGLLELDEMAGAEAAVGQHHAVVVDPLEGDFVGDEGLAGVVDVEDGEGLPAFVVEVVGAEQGVRGEVGIGAAVEIGPGGGIDGDVRFDGGGVRADLAESDLAGGEDEAGFIAAGAGFVASIPAATSRTAEYIGWRIIR